MANVTFCYPDWTQPTSQYTPTITGPAWIGLDLLQGEILSEMARCPSVLLADTQLVIDCKTTRSASVIVLPAHSAYPGDLARVRLATDAGFTNVVADTGWQEFFPPVYAFGALPWGDESFWGGYMTLEQTDGYVIPWIATLATPVLYRYAKVEIDAQTNPAGYFDLGAVVISPGITPRYNISYGIQFGHRDDSRRERSRGAVPFVDQATLYRTASMQLDWLSMQEAFGPIWEMQRRLGTSGRFFFLYDSADDPAVRFKRSFMAQFGALKPITHPRFGQYAVGADIEEVK